MPDRRALVVLALGLAAACSSGTPETLDLPTQVAGTTGSLTDQSVGLPPSSLDLKALPLGSGRSAATPTVGALMRCRQPMGGPPVTIPPWVDQSRGTWDLTAKPASAGDQQWQNQVTAERQGDQLVVRSNGLPRRSGDFPVRQDDPTFAYNPNPGTVFEHQVELAVPYDPSPAAEPSCESGVVGVAVDGAPILDGFDAGGLDAVAVEVQDICHGHPNDRAGYHYHGLSPCLADRTRTSLVGWALDGFGIFAEVDAGGRLLTNADLDACHGRTSTVPWHGRQQRVYHYVMTHEFPYSVGCFRGTPVSSAQGLGLPPG